MVTELQDTKLLTQIGIEDLIAKEVKYHLKCLVRLRLTDTGVTKGIRNK